MVRHDDDLFLRSSENIQVFLLFFVYLCRDDGEKTLTYHLSDISAIEQHIITKYNKDTDKHKSPDIRKVLIYNTKIIYKNNSKKYLQILKAISIKKNPTINETAFNTSINISNVFDN